MSWLNTESKDQSEIESKEDSRWLKNRLHFDVISQVHKDIFLGLFKAVKGTHTNERVSIQAQGLCFHDGSRWMRQPEEQH